MSLLVRAGWPSHNPLGSTFDYVIIWMKPIHIQRIWVEINIFMYALEQVLVFELRSKGPFGFGLVLPNLLIQMVLVIGYSVPFWFPICFFVLFFNMGWLWFLEATEMRPVPLASPFLWIRMVHENRAAEKGKKRLRAFYRCCLQNLFTFLDSHGLFFDFFELWDYPD